MRACRKPPPAVAYKILIRNYVAYYRVSTKAQGQSGLGLEAQRSAVRRFAKAGEQILEKFTEVESGKRDGREQLQAAIVLSNPGRPPCSPPSATASAATPASSSPCATAAWTSSARICRRKHIDDRYLCRARPARARAHQLQVKKAQGARLGSSQNLTLAARQKGERTRREKAAANENNHRAAAMIESLRAKDIGWAAISRLLNEAGFRASQGGAFQATQVQRI